MNIIQTNGWCLPCEYRTQAFGRSTLAGNLPSLSSSSILVRPDIKHASKWYYFKPTEFMFLYHRLQFWLWSCLITSCKHISECVYYVFSKEHQKDFTCHSIYWRKSWRENGLLARWSIWKGLLLCKRRSLDAALWSLIPEAKLNLQSPVLVDVACLIVFMQSSCTVLSFFPFVFLSLNSPDAFLASIQFIDFVSF